MCSTPHNTNKQKSQRAIIFGAGDAGKCAYQYLQKEFHILGFCDNSSQKQGQRLHDLPVFSPSELSGMPLDRILIASEYFEQIAKQISAQLPNVDIEVLPSRMTRPLQLGSSERTISMAVEILHFIAALFNEHQTRYYVDAGTLLGIYRDQALIPWDDDLDFALDASHLEQARALLEQSLEMLTAKTQCRWALHQYTCDRDFGAVRRGSVRVLKLVPSDTRFPVVDFFVKYIDGEWMDYCLASRGIRMPSEHFFHPEIHRFANKSLMIPAKVEEYLERHYGDWRTPKRDWSLADLKNTTVFTDA